VKSSFIISWIYCRLFLEDVFPATSHLCFILGFSKKDLEFYLSNCLLETLNGLAVKDASSIQEAFEISRMGQLQYLQKNTEISSIVTGSKITDFEVSEKKKILSKISNFGYRSLIHGGAFTILGAVSDINRKYNSDPVR